MKRKTDDRIEQLRQDPDFRALVDLLRQQPNDRLEAALDELESKDHTTSPTSEDETG